MSAVIDFEIGQQVMVPMRGMCTVEDVKEEVMLGQSHKFVHLRPHRGEGVIKMPVNQLADQGVRSIETKEQILAVLEDETPVEDLSQMASFERLDLWTDKIRSGDYGTRIQVLREIALAEKKSQLDRQEQKFKKQLRLAARREIETALKTSAASAGRRLNLALQ